MSIAGYVSACQEPDPNFGDPGGIIGKRLPGEKATTSASSSGGGSTKIPDVPALTTSLKEAHTAAKQATADLGDCMVCHQGTPGPKFAFGGLATEKDLIVTVSGLDPVRTDAEGYFWSTQDAEVAKDSQVSVQKDGSKPNAMLRLLEAGKAGGGCMVAGCHDTLKINP